MISLRPHRQIVAVSWDHHELVCVVATRLADGFRLDNTISIAITAEHAFAAASKDLSERLERAGTSSYALLLALPRTQVEIMELRLPPAAADELPLLVRNELTRQDAEVSESALVDFQTLDSQPGEPTTVEVAVVRPDTQQMIGQLTSALGKDAAQIVVRFQAVASLFKRQVKKLPQASLLLNLMQVSADVSVLNHHRITFTRSIHLSADDQADVDPAHLADEIRRTMFVAPQQSEAQAEIHHVYMFADLQVDDSLVASLADELQMTVSLLDPLADVQLPGARPCEVHRLAALIGMIWDHIDGTALFDFANPKKPPPPPRIGRKIGFYATVASVVILAVGWMLNGDVKRARRQAAELKTEVENNQQIVQRLRSKTQVIDAVDRWQQNQINWLAELQRLSIKLPPADQSMVQRINMVPSSAQGMITMSVRVRDPGVIAELENQLRDERHQVSSQRISPATSAGDAAFQFETRVIVLPPNDSQTPNATSTAK